MPAIPWYVFKGVPFPALAKHCTIEFFHICSAMLIQSLLSCTARLVLLRSYDVNVPNGLELGPEDLG